MMKLTSRIFVHILIFLFVSTTFLNQPYAQMESPRMFDRPLQGGGGSFRQNDAFDQQGRVGNEGDKAFLDRGTMLTQPSMSGLMYQVHVLGEVKNAGTYRIMASERLAEILQRAGGISDNGSNRKIEIKREGRTVKQIDLLKFQLYGQLDHNPYLLDNDVVFVPLKSKTVQVVGAVKRPDTYDLDREKDMLQVVNLAGGFSAGIAQNEPLRVIRFVDGQKSVMEVKQDKNDMAQFIIENGDVVFVPNVVTAGHKFDYDIAKLPGDNVFYPSYEDRVFVLGGVAQPGGFPFSPYYNIQQYITLAGGYTPLSTGGIQIMSGEGKKVKVRKGHEIKINPGDTIIVGRRRIPPEGWVSLVMGIAGFGLSTTSTVFAITRK